MALRRFEHGLGVSVMVPAHLEPGGVVAYSSPVPGILDVARIPHGTSEPARRLAAAPARGFSSQTVEDIGPWKRAKLLVNVGNAVEALCGSPGAPRAGSSTWQSVARGTRTVETDYLNGEIVLLGRLHGADVAANALVARLMNELAADGGRPGRLSEDAILAQLPA